MNIKEYLRKFTELSIMSAAIVALALTGCGGGGGGGGSAPASVLVSTFAGTSGSHAITDGIGATARFQIPAYIASDGTNLYVTDMYANNIRKIVIATGQVTTFAGSITGASGVTDAPSGPGTSALFNNPYGIVIDATNTKLYVADGYNHTIRQIVIATGVVTTLAGTVGTPGSADNATGTLASFRYPMGLSRIGTNLYVADSSNSTIRQIDLASASAAVTTLAGTPPSTGYFNGLTGASSVFYSPTSIATDGASFLYLTDTLNNDVRRIDVSTGATTLVAGGNSTLASSGVGSSDGIGANARFNQPMGITTDGSNLYVADTNNHTIRKIVIATGNVTTPAGAALVPGTADGAGPTARFNHPFGIIYINGALYVADYTNGSIRKVQL
ncbi:NHL domain-containing protein [Sideroxydans lithotrophicus]|uniref:NHL repeat-containing protein n=1 Tax=Sideroxydans lithotrophicus (strain ES-1) TaxID=580332 RepID=D5CMR0_SIDLE|nr:NHL repeat-containing protein [Sideroxydans lithotrophicus]ADE10746.1 NHL repeat-containing protein [Sideroxydans lithotrophicus ES-1]